MGMFSIRSAQNPFCIINSNMKFFFCSIQLHEKNDFIIKMVTNYIELQREHCAKNDNK